MGRFDRLQQRHAVLAFPLAVRQKYADDQGGYLAASVAYYGLFSVFPLLLLLTTVLGFVLRGHPRLDHDIVHSALGQFPVIGNDLKTGALKGNPLALGLGAAGAFWAGLRAVVAVEYAMDQLWGIPFTRRPNFLLARARALLLLVVLGGSVIAATALAGVGTIGTHYGLAYKLGSTAISVLLDFGVFWLSFRVLTAANVSWSGLRAGAATAAVGYEALQLLGGYYIGHVLRHASNLYGTFALVIGLLSFMYLAIHVMLIAAEVNVVRAHNLWPRSFSLGPRSEEPATSGDRSALVQLSEIDERRPDEEIDVHISTPSNP